MGLFNKANIGQILSVIGAPFLFGIPLFFNIMVGVYFRTPSLPSLEGGLLHGPDSYRHMRHVEQIAKDGQMPETDEMRHVPYGHRNSLQSIVFPWLIARGYQILACFVPKLSLYQVAIFYPLAMFTLVTVLFFCLTKQLFNFPVAFFATSAFVSMAGFVEKTRVGRVDTDAIIICLFLLAIYFYQWNSSKSLNRQGIGRFAFSIILGILGSIWSGVAIAAVLLYGCDFLVVHYKGIHWKRAVFSILGVLCYLSCLLIPSGTYMENLLDPFVLFAIAPALLAMGGYIVALLKYTQWGNRHMAIFGRVAWAAIVVGSFSICLNTEVLKHVLIRLVYPFGNDPIMIGIEELQHFEIDDWWRSYGLFILVAFLGLGILIYESWSVVKKDLRHPNSHLAAITIATLGMILCRGYTSFFAAQSLTISALFMTIMSAWVVLHAAYIALKGEKPHSLIVIIWFVVAFNLTCSAVRFSLFLAPALALASSIALVKVFEFLMPNNRKSLLTYSLLTISLVSWQILLTGSDIFSLLFQYSLLSSFDFQLSPRGKIIVTLIPSLILLGVLCHRYTELPFQTIHRNMRLCASFGVLCLSWFVYTGVGGLGFGQKVYATELMATPHPPPAVREAIQWLKQNTPSHSVVAASWDYGSAINQLGERATIIDDEQNVQTIRSFYRQVICSENSEVALAFLKKHRVTHLMLTLQELSGLVDIYKFAYPGRKSNFPLIIPLKMNTQDPYDHREFSPMENHRVLLPQVNLLDNAQTAIELLKISVDYVESDGYLDVPAPPQAEVNSPPPQKMRLQEIIHNNQQWYFPSAELSGTLWINDAVESHGAFSHLHFNIAAFFSEAARNFWISKLFLDNSNDHFRLVFITKNGYARIWEIIQ